MTKLLQKSKTLTQMIVVKEQCYMSRSSEGRGDNAVCLWKGHDLSNIVWEDEVNTLPNDKVITEIQNFKAKW